MNENFSSVNFKCPNCGNSIVFDPITSKFLCNFCSSTFEKDDIQDNLIGSESEKNNYSYNEDQDNLKEYHCNNCGANMIMEKTKTATNCAYCNSPVIINDRLKDEFKPKYVIPFQIDVENAKDIYFKWIKGRFFAPKEFKDLNINELSGIYVPFWLFDTYAEGFIDVSATKIRQYSDANYDYVETNYYNVYREGKVKYDMIPINGSSKFNEELMNNVGIYNYSKIKKFDMAYLSGFEAQSYDILSENCKDDAISTTENFLSDRLYEQIVGYDGKTIVNSNFNVNILNIDYGLLPIYYLNVNYKDKEHLFVINGQTGNTYGDAPIDYGKVFITFMLFTGIFYILVDKLFN